MFDFLEYAATEMAAIEPRQARCYMEGGATLAMGEARGLTREEINARYYRLFEGMRHTALQQLCRSWQSDLSSRHPDCWIAHAVQALRDHQRTGVDIVLVSGSFVELLRPLADALGVEHVLATVLEVDGNGCLTGAICPPQMIGVGKATAITRFVATRDVDMASSFAYGDHHSDIHMLEMVGHAGVVGQAGTMADEAVRRGWRVLAA